MSSIAQINNHRFEVKNGKVYLNGNEIIENTITKSVNKSRLCAWFGVGFMCGVIVMFSNC